MSYNVAYMTHIPVKIDTEKGLPALQDITADQFEMYFARLSLTGRKNAAVHDRAINGVERGVYFKGQRVATERHFSDSLLLALAKANNPRYREHISVDANVAAGVLVVHKSLNPDDWESKYAGMRSNEGGPDPVRKKSVTSTVKDDG
jgi:hypothetical protein